MHAAAAMPEWLDIVMTAAEAALIALLAMWGVLSLWGARLAARERRLERLMAGRRAPAFLAVDHRRQTVMLGAGMAPARGGVSAERAGALAALAWSGAQAVAALAVAVAAVGVISGGAISGGGEAGALDRLTALAHAHGAAVALALLAALIHLASQRRRWAPAPQEQA